MSGWLLRYNGFDPRSEGLREALCALGNGRFMTRGAAPESIADDVHCPSTYVAGVFNRLGDDIAGRHIENESIVNLPDWQSLSFRPVDGDWIQPQSAAIRDYVQELDIRRGILTRRFRVAGLRRDAARRWRNAAPCPWPTRTSPCWTAPWSRRTGRADWSSGRASTAGSPTSASAATRVFPTVISSWKPARRSTTTSSRWTARRRNLTSGSPSPPGNVCCSTTSRSRSNATWSSRTATSVRTFELDLREGQRCTVEKVVALYTSQDRAITEPGIEAREKARCAPDVTDAFCPARPCLGPPVGAMRSSHSPASERADLILHLHLFHLLQTLSTHSVDLDVGIPARGLHGEAYRGHIFWDAMFVYPYLSLRMPELARALLLYRWRRLPQARKAAHDIGCRGAMFPWQSGSNGREETQQMHLNPKSGTVAARPFASAAPHQRRHRLQHLEVLRGDRRPEFPQPIRRGNHLRDRQVLDEPRDLRQSR